MRISDWSSDVCSSDLVLADEVGRAGQHPLLVLEEGLGHQDRRGGRRVEGRAGLQQADDLGAAVAGALDDLVEPLLAEPAHLDERSEEHTSELQSLMRISYAVFCLKKKNTARSLEHQQ